MSTQSLPANERFTCHKCGGSDGATCWRGGTPFTACVKCDALALKPAAYARCICGHIHLTHGPVGCEGIYTVLDEQGGYGQSGACGCREFKKEERL